MQHTYDYHGLSVVDALSRFVTDYCRALRSELTDRTFRIVHGYIHGDAIKRVLRRLLSFEMSRGVLTFTASEDVVHHPGYSVVTAIRPLQAIPIGLFDACFDDLCFLDGVLNSTIERIEWEYAHPLEQKGNTLPAAALNALNQIRTSSTDEHANV